MNIGICTELNFVDYHLLQHSCKQIHYREVPWWEIFMEQELRFELDLGQMANFPAFIASKSMKPLSTSN